MKEGVLPSPRAEVPKPEKPEAATSSRLLGCGSSSNPDSDLGGGFRGQHDLAGRHHLALGTAFRAPEFERILWFRRYLGPHGFKGFPTTTEGKRELKRLSNPELDKCRRRLRAGCQRDCNHSMNTAAPILKSRIYLLWSRGLVSPWQPIALIFEASSCKLIGQLAASRNPERSL